MNGMNHYEDLMNDLIYLRKDAGFTNRRFRQASVFLEIIGGKQTYEMARKRLLSAIYALPEQADTELLLMAFGLDKEYESVSPLKLRREMFALQTGFSVDTIANYETAALNELAIFLLSNRYTRSPMPGNAPVMHDVAIHEFVQITTLVRDKLWVESRELYRTVPLIDGVEYFEISSDIPAKITDSSASAVRTETAENGLRHRLFFAEPLERGKIAELSFTIQPDGTRDEELILTEETRAFHLPTIASEMEILFLGEKPELIWHFSQLPVFERPGKAKKECLLDLNGGSSVRVRWDELNSGLYSGIAWRWKCGN